MRSSQKRVYGVQNSRLSTTIRHCCIFLLQRKVVQMQRLINSSDKCQIRDRRRTWLGYGLYTGHIEWVFDMHYMYGYT